MASSCAEGLSDYSAAVPRVLVIARAPPAPREPPSLTAVAADGTIEIAWRACASDPHAPIESYEVHKRCGGALVGCSAVAGVYVTGSRAVVRARRTLVLRASRRPTS